jgi:hypothetical protein
MTCAYGTTADDVASMVGEAENYNRRTHPHQLCTGNIQLCQQPAALDGTLDEQSRIPGGVQTEQQPCA